VIGKFNGVAMHVSKPERAIKARHLSSGLVNAGPLGTVRAISDQEMGRSGQKAMIANSIAETVVDWDFGQDSVGRSMTMHGLPSTTPVLIFQYRARVRSMMKFGDGIVDRGVLGTVATSVQSGVVVLRSSGPVGLMLVRLKPESVSRVVGDQAHALLGGKIELDLIFGHSNVDILEERLSNAGASGERSQLVLEFLDANTRPRPIDRRLAYAVRVLRQNPTVRIRSLAERLQISERQLVRWFTRDIGASPKYFARLARFQKVMTAYSAGLAWAELSYANGFVDQAHLINDVGTILGASPTEALYSIASDGDAVGLATVMQPLVMW
jgi:AraC-like DNA-binding protein